MNMNRLGYLLGFGPALADTAIFFSLTRLLYSRDVRPTPTISETTSKDRVVGMVHVRLVVADQN